MTYDIISFQDAADEYALQNVPDGDTVTLSLNILLIKDRVSYSIVYGASLLVKYFKNGKITLYSDESSTTKICNKLDQFTPDCVNIIQRKFVPFVQFYGVTLPFNESFTFDPEKKEVYDESPGVMLKRLTS